MHTPWPKPARTLASSGSPQTLCRVYSYPVASSTAGKSAQWRMARHCAREINPWVRGHRKLPTQWHAHQRPIRGASHEEFVHNTRFFRSGRKQVQADRPLRFPCLRRELPRQEPARTTRDMPMTQQVAPQAGRSYHSFSCSSVDLMVGTATALVPWRATNVNEAKITWGNSNMSISWHSVLHCVIGAYHFWLCCG